MLKLYVDFKKWVTQQNFLVAKGGDQPSALQQATVRVLSNAQCQKSYATDAPGGIAKHMLCAASAGKDACSVSKILLIIARFLVAKVQYLLTIILCYCQIILG